MSSEYILFNRFELNNIEKTFLITQIGILNSLKNLRNYKKARAEEFASKIRIKTLLNETHEELKVLDKTLPQTSFKPTEEEKPELVSIINHQLPPDPKRDAIEEELERIKNRLSLLQ
ncbi:MAG: hypothetical protein AABX66_00110 [Nanoarchaeota archaeon]